MHHPKLLRSKCVRSAMIPAALLCVIVSGCADQQPTGPKIRPRVARINDVAFNNVPFDKFFVAWSQSYSSSPIQTQTFALDTRQDRQSAGWWADEGVLSFARANSGRLYINGDEPDQGCIAPYDYAGIYHDFVVAVRGADPTARFSPGGFTEPNDFCCPLPADEQCRSSMHSISYADQFYNAYVQRYGVAPPVNEWRFHDFGISFADGDVNGWWSRVDSEAAWSVAHGANMVLGAWGFIRWEQPTSAFQEHMKQAIGRLMNDTRINGAVYWHRDRELNAAHYLVNSDGSLTPEGQTFVNPLTDIPTSVKILGSTNRQAKLRWSNTTSAWAAEVEFWVQARGSNSYVYSKTELVAGPGGTQTPFVAFNSGDKVKARVRYYNVYSQAAWSSFSRPALMASPELEADERTVVRKRPLFCLLHWC
jgi:hypothetical protein